MNALNSSIESSYFYSISTGFYKRSDLFWEQRVGSSNPLAPTSSRNEHPLALWRLAHRIWLELTKEFGNRRPFRLQTLTFWNSRIGRIRPLIRLGLRDGFCNPF
jgi:hypothetical protein